ncbi:hypothetical protein FAZ19_11420 [Sphingobacterium alkalisoli]|uniref:Uncharacterized protein n=1 Tax=Sphingobacterium alkalisoli TaxID=1874115 RepID=A0A4U0H2M1_9SPHI|nr:hypothetical protein [Sphingobacterium alkalisoli]TJY65726.1 hypothetical protein FAZ19_11420 [Sphingobacterium alkalisoli]GGH18718.1 hypothetical protein GCM10011418_22550 [Sphingobacterium alkalisoli]
MKNILLILCCLAHLGVLRPTLAQHRPEIYLGGGAISGPKETYFVTGKGGNIGSYFPFMSNRFISLGIDLGAGFFSSKNRTSKSIAPYLLSGVGSPTVGVDSSLMPSQHVLRFGAGPRADFHVGEKLQLSAAVDGGINILRQDPIAFDQYVGTEDRMIKKRIYSRDKVDSKSFHVMPRIRLSYPLGNNLKVWAEGNYSLSKYNYNEQRLQTVDVNGNPIQELGQFVEAGYAPNNGSESWKSFGAQMGLALQLGKQKTNSSMKTPKSQERIAQTSLPRKEESPKQEERRSVQPISPKNNSQFQSDKELKAFTWRLVGGVLPTAQYSIDVVQVDARQGARKSYQALSSKTALSVQELTKGLGLEPGQYRWQVTELTKGLVSTPQFFAISNCDIQFTIQDEEISCMGYVGENRKYKICFSSVYNSASGDLTYVQPGTGLTVFDQSYNSLNYTLVAPQPILVTQVGTSSSTVQYCFEVEVPSSVTAIGIGLQGDDLDPGPIFCQPGVSTLIDSLPECICEDCKDMTFNFDDMQINPVQTAPYAFSFQGSLQVSQPIYAIELQVLSYQYTANPEPCSGGITSLEEAGMLLRNGSSINGSTNLNFYTAAGNSNSNPNASKVVKYLSSSALTGNIPIDLIVGLPGPAAGFDADCCKMNYEVCFKIVVYYDQANCKSCVFTKCFQFTN